MKQINPDILIGILIASLFWVGIFIWQSSQPPYHASTTSQTCEGTKNECAKATTDERIADYTWWLAVLTAALVSVSAGQGYFLLRSDKTARVTANAADLSARAAIALELPIIQVAPTGFGFGSSWDGDSPRIENCSLSDLRFSNLGRTKAFPVEVHCGWFVGDKLPNIPIYTFTKQFRMGLIFEPDPEITSQLHVNECECVGVPNFYDKVRDETISLWLFCSLVYLDFMQTRHEVGFCWQRWETMGKGGFRADAAPSYNRKT